MMSIRSSDKPIKTNAAARKKLRLPKMHELFSFGYYKMNVRQQWPLFMVFAIALFFAIPVVILFGVQDVSVRYPIALKYDNVIEAVTIASYIISICAGLFASTAVTRDFMKQNSAGFVHALPIRREGQLLVRLAAGVTVYLAAYALNLVLGILVSILVGASAYLGMMFPPVFTSLMIFLFIYTLNTASGMLCGTSITQFILTALTMVVPPLTYFMTIAWIQEHVWEFWAGWYTSEDKTSVFPGMRLIFTIADGNTFGIIDYLVFGVLSLLLIAVSVVLYRMRVNERSGDAAMFGIVGPIVKYVSMVPAALIGGIFFFEAASGDSAEVLWWMFGWVCAALLTFMLVNAVVYRSAGAVMKGIKWAPIFAVTFLVLNILIMGDAANLSGYVPNPSTLSSVTLRIDSMDIVLKDKDNLRAVAQIAAQANYGDTREPTYNLSQHAYETTFYGTNGKPVTAADFRFGSNQVNFNAVFRLKGGIPIAKYYYVENKSDIADALRTITNSEEFAKQYKANVEKYGVSEFYVSLGLAEGDNYSFSSTTYGYVDEYGLMHESEPATINCVTDEVNAAYFERPQLGSVHIYGNADNDYRTVEIPLFFGDPLTYEVDKAADMFEESYRPNDDRDETYGGAMKEENFEDFVDRFVANIGVTDTVTGEAYTFTKKSEIYEIMKNVQSVCEGRVSMFSIPDSRYWVTLWLKEYRYNDSSFVTFFIDGKVPEFVSARFAAQ